MLDLEISKPQKNSRQAQEKNANRKDRSPDHGRDNNQNRGGRRGNNNGRNANDSYDGRSEARDEYGRPLRMRRSPSPPRGSFRPRDDYGHRGRDSYSRDQRRSRSRSPYGNRDNVRYRERSPSLRRNQDSELQIPRREWNQVPDVQIIMMEQLDRGFVDWVEKQFFSRGLKTEVMILSPRVPLEAVIQRQIVEGVHAVSQLNARSQGLSKIPLQVFKRQGGANVQWEEYQDLDPHIAAELVLREKNTQPPPQPPPVQYAPPQYAPAPQYHSPPQAPPQLPPQIQPHLAGMLDQATLQNLLGTLNAQQHNAPAASANSAVDLAALIGGLQNQQRQQPQPSNAYPPPPDPYAAHGIPPQQMNYLGQQAQPPQQSAQQVQNIMATLNKYRH